MKDEVTADPKGPRSIIWLVTSRCNLSCRHCYATRFPKEGELSEEEALNLIDQAAELGVRHIGFTGGEAFLRSDTLKLMQRAHRQGIGTTVVTNSLLLSDELLERLREETRFATPAELKEQIAQDVLVQPLLIEIADQLLHKAHCVAQPDLGGEGGREVGAGSLRSGTRAGGSSIEGSVGNGSGASSLRAQPLRNIPAISRLIIPTNSALEYIATSYSPQMPGIS